MTLRFENVGIRFGGNPELTVAEIDLDLPHGSTVGLVGESGSGKSSVAKAGIGMNPLATGRIMLDGVELASPAKPLRQAARHGVQLVFQDPRTSMNPRMTIAETLIEAVRLDSQQAGTGRRRTPAEAEARALQLLDLVRLAPEHLARYPHELSGGQLQRISIARALATHPRYLLLDEVTASLDVSVQAAVLNLLRELQERLGFAMLYISHDLSVIRYVSDHVYVMERGRVVEHADTGKLFKHPQTEYTQRLLRAVPRLGGGRWSRRNA